MNENGKTDESVFRYFSEPFILYREVQYYNIDYDFSSQTEIYLKLPKQETDNLVRTVTDKIT